MTPLPVVQPPRSHRPGASACALGLRPTTRLPRPRNKLGYASPARHMSEALPGNDGARLLQGLGRHGPSVGPLGERAELHSSRLRSKRGTSGPSDAMRKGWNAPAADTALVWTNTREYNSDKRVSISYY